MKFKFTSFLNRDKEPTPLQEKLYSIIFGWETPEGKLFDVILFIVILVSILVVMLESVESYQERFGGLFIVLEWLITIFFTVEYVLRLYCARDPKKYAKSFYGIVDFVTILPTYLSLFLTGTHYLAIIRSLRLLRAFKIFELSRYTSQGFILMISLRKSFAKIAVFLVFVLIFTSIIGAVMYVVEGSEPYTGFDSIPRSIYWAIVTLTTVGYGDIAPSTPFGQFLAAIIMILGYSIIAIPTGIVSADMVNEAQAESRLKGRKRRVCPSCKTTAHSRTSLFCYHCGEGLPINPDI